MQYPNISPGVVTAIYIYILFWTSVSKAHSPHSGKEIIVMMYTLIKANIGFNMEPAHPNCETCTRTMQNLEY